MNSPQNLYACIVAPRYKPRMQNFVLQDWIEPILDIQEHIDDITRAANSKIPVDTQNVHSIFHGFLFDTVTEED